MTQEQINRIHADKTAILGKIYTGPNGVLYSGTKGGYLIQEQTLNGDLKGTTLRAVISQIGNYSTEELSEILISVANKLDKSEFEKYKPEAKCFAIAMAAAL